MIIFLIIMGIIFVIALFFFLLCISNLQIQVKDLIVNSKNERGRKVEGYIVYIRLKILNKLTFLKIKLDEEKIKRTRALNKNILNRVKEVEKELMYNTKKVLNKKNTKLIKQLDIKIEKLDLYLKIGLIDTFFTSISIALISSLISIILAKTTDSYHNSKYFVMPAYNSELLLKINLNCIINIKMIHIINVIYMLINKKRSVEYDERTSNRRTYVCSND